MKVTPDQFASAYEALVQDVFAHDDRKLLIFVAAGEADSVSATRIVRKMLQTDSVMHTIIPVTGYDHLQQACQDMLKGDNDEYRSILLINCGVTEDIRELLDLGKEVRAYVIDAHRPVHLNNLSPDNQQVYLMWDEAVEASSNDIPVGLAELYSESESDSESEGSESEGASGDGMGGSRMARDGDEAAGGGSRGASGDTARVEDDGEDPLGLHGGSQDPEEGEVDSLRARARRSGEVGVSGAGAGAGAGAPLAGRKRRATREELRRAKRRAKEERVLRRIEYYARGQHYGRSASELCLRLCQELRKDDKQLLWLAVLGLTDQLVHGHVGREGYAVSYEELLSRVKQADNYDQQTEVQHNDGTITKAFVRGRIVEEEALRLHLYRHWSLYDSIIYSPFVATKLRTWSEGGRAAVEQLLAKMGLPLKEAKKAFSAMDPDVRRQLPAKMDQWVTLFQIEDIKFDSFKLHFGYQDAMGAVDMVAAVTALLEAGPDQPSQFWTAMDALSLANVAEIQRGLELSKEIQRAVIEHAGRAIQARRVERYHGFCCVNLSEGLPARSRELLCFPMALTRLATFIQDAHASMGGSRAFLRMVVVGPEEHGTGKCWVVGVTSRLLRGTAGNALSVFFQNTLDKIESAASNDAFLASTVRIPTGEVNRFIDELHDVVLAAEEDAQ